MFTTDEICDAVKEGAIQAASEMGATVALTPNDLGLAEGVHGWEESEWRSLLDCLSREFDLEESRIEEFLPLDDPSTTRILYVKGDLYLYAQLDTEGVPVLLIGPPEIQPRTFTEEDHRKCIRDIDEFFSTPRGESSDVLQRAIEHMVASVRPGTHAIECLPCWDYYMAQKRLYCGG